MKLNIIVRGLFGIAAALSVCACIGAAPDGEESEELAVAEEEVQQFCGGFAAIRCPDKYVCVDDPSDDCDPATGGDCGGICVKDKDKDKDKCESDTRSYVSTDPQECAVIRFLCAGGSLAFSDQCGCGCERVAL